MTTLLFDTETSGLFNAKLAYDDPAQGRMLQLGCVLLDEQFKEIASFCSLIKPDGWSYISPEATNRHGKTLELCNELGIPCKVAMSVFDEFLQKADLRVGHAVEFDCNIVDVERTFLGATHFENWKTPETICTMKLMTPICQLKHTRYNNGTFKWPKLQEAHKFIFGNEFDNAHDALADVHATAKIFRWLVMNGYIQVNHLTR